MTYYEGLRAAKKGGLILEEEEMLIPQDRGQIPRCNHWLWYYLHRSCKGQSHYRLANTNKG